MKTETTDDGARTLSNAVAAGHEWDLTVQSFGITEKGLVRESNEDQFVVAKISRAIQLQQSSLSQARTLFADRHGHLFIVADGMGGHRAGEQASTLAVVTIEEFVLNTLKWFFRLNGESILTEFQVALRAADARIFEESARHPELKGMGTTVTMGYTSHEALYVVHVGDSRCYLWRGGHLRQLTRDHTIVEEMLRSGALTPDEAAHNPMRNIVTNAVGGNEPGITVEVRKVLLKPDDVVLFCSDGLNGMVGDDEIARILSTEREPEVACQRLVREANKNGGTDNITVIVARFDAALGATTSPPRGAATMRTPV